MCCKRYHIIFSTFSLKFKCKICVQKELIHNFKSHILVTWTATNLLILRYEPLIVFRIQNHITFLFIKTMSDDLLVQMAYCQFIWSGKVYLFLSVWEFKKLCLWQPRLDKLMHIENWNTDHLQHYLYVDVSYKFTLAWVFVNLMHVHRLAVAVG